MPQQLIILLLSIIGFVLSFYIYQKTARNERLTCMLGEDCNKVVYSRFARIFGIQNTVIGILYYGAIAITYAFFIIAPQFHMPPFFLLSLTLATGVAAAFSAYLIFVQIIILKNWCEWCFFSAFISLMIFFLTFL